MNTLTVYETTINAILKGKGYPIEIGLDNLEGNTMQDDTFICAAIVVRDQIKERRNSRPTTKREREHQDKGLKESDFL